MILNEVIQRPELFAIRRLSVSENGIEISFSPELLDKNGELCDDKVCILKLDEHEAYNSKKTHNPPPVIDNLVIVKCGDNTISIYLIELRKSNGKTPTRRLNPKEIEDKFSTAIYDFIEKKYSDIFRAENIKNLKAYLVSDPWCQSGKENAQELFNKKIKLSALDAFGSRKPFSIFGKRVLINPMIPPNPVIQPC